MTHSISTSEGSGVCTTDSMLEAYAATSVEVVFYKNNKISVYDSYKTLLSLNPLTYMQANSNSLEKSKAYLMCSRTQTPLARVNFRLDR